MGNLNLREMREEMERTTLSPFATLSANSSRRTSEPLCLVRTEFQRDRDRILYSKAFRRLMHKTQVFIAPEGDHYRTRLTHTIEVSQIGRTIARALKLNEDLTEAISLGHDLGHAPFGHAGEEVLDTLMKQYVGEAFHHSVQSLRVVDRLEREGGLNLTEEVRNGILSHTKGKQGIKSEGVFAEPKTLEAAVVRIADRLAYINHDIDDAIRAKIIAPDDIPWDLRNQFGNGISERIQTMVMDIVECSWDKPKIEMSDKMSEGLDRLKDFMFEKVYNMQSPAKKEEKKSQFLLKQLFDFFMEHPEKIPKLFIDYERGGELMLEPVDFRTSLRKGTLPEHIDPEDRKVRARSICDFIAGMTDRYAMAIYNQFFVPRGWNVEEICVYDTP